MTADEILHKDLDYQQKLYLLFAELTNCIEEKHSLELAIEYLAKNIKPKE